MKKPVLLILILCCLLSACSLSEPQASAAPSAGASAVPAAARSAAPMTAVSVPLVKAGAVIPDKYQEKPLRPSAGSGVFQLCTDPVEMQQGSHYNAYVPNADGQLTLLENKVFNNAYTLHGSRYHISLNWADNSGIKLANYAEPENPAMMLPLSDDGSESLFLLRGHLNGGTGTMYSYYPVLIDLESGELTDILAGCKLDNITKISNVAFSPDRKGLLLAQEGGALYYCDIAGGSVYSLDELSGEPAKACAISGDRLICWNQGGSGAQAGGLGDHHFWYIGLDDLKRHEMPELEADVDTAPLRFTHIAGFDSLSRNGGMFSGSTYALCTGGDGSSYVLDMAAWSLRPLEGYTMPASNTVCLGSPDGQRLLLKDMDSGKAHVLDYASGKLSRLDIQNVHSLDWFDSDTLIEQPGDGNFYLYDVK